MHHSCRCTVVWAQGRSAARGQQQKGAGALGFVLDFDDLLHRLEQLEGRSVRVLYLGVLADGRLPMPEEPVRTGLRIRWGGRLLRVRCVPPIDECRRFRLKPRRILLIFERGVRMVVEVDQVVDMRVMTDGLGLLLRQGRAVYILTRL